MDAHFQDARIEGYEHLTDTITLPDTDDRHVLAAAIHGSARIIVTTNLRDFPDAALAAFDIEAAHPDAFILGLLHDRESEVVAALRRLRASFKNPPQAAIDLLANMNRHGLTASADALGPFIDSF